MNLPFLRVAAMSAFLLSLPLLAQGAPAAKAKETPRKSVVALVAPFAIDAEDGPWSGFAVAEVITDLFAQENVGGFLTSKQLDGALRRKDLKLSDASDPEIALPLAKTMGATDLILGAVHRTGGKLQLEAKRYSVVSREFTRQETVSGGPDDLPTLAAQLAQKLLDVNAKTRPMSSNVKALEQAANCWFDLVRYPLQPRVGNTPALETAAADEASCKAALLADGQLTWAHAGSAILKSLKGDTTGARAEIKSARSKGRFEAWLAIADYFAARRAHDANGARASLEGALKERPGFFMAAGYLAEERMEAEDYKGAAAAWDRVLKIAPRHPFALGQKGKAFGLMHKDIDALALTRQALDVDPGDPELMVELASRQIDARQNQEAEATLRQVMQAKPPRPRAWLRLGYLYMRENRMQDAHDTLTEALTYAYRDDEARTRGIAFGDLAQVAGAQGNYPEAIQYLQQAKSEGTSTLPCDAPELRAFRGRPEFNAICPAK